MPGQVSQIKGGNPVTVRYNVSASYIVLSLDPLYHPAAKNKKVSGSSVSLYNLIPGKRYFYKLLNGGSIVREGCFTPAGPLRMIKVADVVNIRDLGGWEAEGGKHIAYGKIYRGYQMDGGQWDNQSKAFIDSLGINVDLDMRGRYSSAATNTYHNNAAGFTNENESSYFKAGSQVNHPENSYINLQVQQLMYQDGALGITAGLYRVAIRYIIRKLSAGKTVYFHCWGGADRTGTLAFLLEALLGVAEGDLSQDYELTTFGGNRRIRTTTPPSDFPFKTFVTGYLYPGFHGNTIQEIVTAWAMDKTIDSEYMDVEPLTSDEISTLKALLLE